MGDQDNSNELRSSARYHTLTGFLLLLILLYNVPASFLWGEHFALFFFLSGESKPGKLTLGNWKKETWNCMNSPEEVVLPRTNGSNLKWEVFFGSLMPKAKKDGEGTRQSVIETIKGWRIDVLMCPPSPGNTTNLTKLSLTLPVLWTDSSVSLFRMTQVAENYPIKGNGPSQGGSHPRLFGARLCRPGHLP